MTAGCVCTHDYVGTRDEQRTLNRDCPVHGTVAVEQLSRVHRVGLDLGEIGFGSRVTVDGKPVRGLGGVTVDSRAGSLTKVTLHMPRAAVAVHGPAVVQFDESTHAGLMALGWTPPAVDEDSPLTGDATPPAAELGTVPVSAAAPGAGGPAGGGLQSGGHSSPAVDGLVGPGVMLRCGQCPSNIALAADPAVLVAQRAHDAYLRHSRVCMGPGVRG